MRTFEPQLCVPVNPRIPAGRYVFRANVRSLGPGQGLVLDQPSLIAEDAARPAQALAAPPKSPLERVPPALGYPIGLVSGMGVLLFARWVWRTRQGIAPRPFEVFDDGQGPGAAEIQKWKTAEERGKNSVSYIPPELTAAPEEKQIMGWMRKQLHPGPGKDSTDGS